MNRGGPTLPPGNRRRMRILFLSQRFVLPMDTGGKICTGKLLEQLRDRATLTLVSNIEHSKDQPFLRDVDRLCSRFVPVPWREVPRTSLIYYPRLLLQSLRALPVSALNDYSATLQRAVETEIASQSFDLAICDFVQSALMFQHVSGIPTLLFQHNVESAIPRRHMDRSTSAVAKLFWWLQWKKMVRFEQQSCRQFDTVIAVSESDAAQMRHLYGVDNVEPIPTGVDTEFYYPAPDADSRTAELVFCGSMDWLPNQDAMRYFIAEVLPLVRRTLPDATLTIVGRNPAAALERLVDSTHGVRLTGWVDDTRPHIAAGRVFIVPIRIGGGTRMKIYEGMAMNRVVLSTSIGAEGLDYENGHNIVLADDAASFAAETVSLVTDDRRRQHIAAAGRQHVARKFSWQRVASVFLDICERTAESAVS